jgi:hypothetical protein
MRAVHHGALQISVIDCSSPSPSANPKAGIVYLRWLQYSKHMLPFGLLFMACTAKLYFW